MSGDRNNFLIRNGGRAARCGRLPYRCFFTATAFFAGKAFFAGSAFLCGFATGLAKAFFGGWLGLAAAFAITGLGGNLCAGLPGTTLADFAAVFAGTAFAATFLAGAWECEFG
jgi:hypothetical protein